MGANADSFFKLEAAAQPSLLHQYEIAAAALGLDPSTVLGIETERSSEASSVLDVANYDAGRTSVPLHSSTGCGLRDRAFMFTSPAATPGPSRARVLHTSSAAYSAPALATPGTFGTPAEGEAPLRVLNVIDGKETEAAGGADLPLIDATTGRPRGSVCASGASPPLQPM